MSIVKKLVVIGLISLGLFGCSDKEVLHVFTWSDYFDPELVIQFEQENNCRVVFDVFDSNEMMYAKLKAGSTGYDIIMPTSYFIPTLFKDGLIDTIPSSEIPTIINNFDHTYDKFIADKELIISIPYAINYSGIMYNKKVVNEEQIKSWNIFDDSNLQGKISFLDDIREVIGMGLIYNHHSINSTNQDEINEAVQTVIKWRKNIRKFDCESYKLEIANGSSFVTHAYSTDAFQIILGEDEESKRDDLGFILPEEGFIASCDEMVVLDNSNHKNLAYKFMDFWYREDIAKDNMIYVCSMMPVKPALENLDDEYKRLFIPDPEKLYKGQIIKSFDNDVDANEMYNKAWDQIKSIKK